MTTTTDISTPDVPLPAGSIGVGDWRRSPNDGAFYRNFLTRIDEVAGLEVRTVGAEVVEDAGGHVIAREIKLIRGNAGVVAALTRGDADALGRALIKSAALVAELEADDVGAVLLDTADQ